MYGGVLEGFQGQGGADSNGSKVNVLMSSLEDRLASDCCRSFCCMDTIGVMLLVTGDSALFDGCAGGLFNFELADFGADDCSGVGLPHVGQKFDMVIGQLKTSLISGSEPGGEE